MAQYCRYDAFNYAKTRLTSWETLWGVILDFERGVAEIPPSRSSDFRRRSWWSDWYLRMKGTISSREGSGAHFKHSLSHCCGFKFVSPWGPPTGLEPQPVACLPRWQAAPLEMIVQIQTVSDTFFPVLLQNLLDYKSLTQACCTHKDWTCNSRFTLSCQKSLHCREKEDKESVSLLESLMYLANVVLFNFPFSTD